MIYDWLKRWNPLYEKVLALFNFLTLLCAWYLNLLCHCLTGIDFGLILKTYAHLTEDDQILIGFPGEMLMRMLQLVTVPLIVTSVITG